MKNNVGAIAIMQRYASALPAQAASCLENTIMTVAPKSPIVKKTLNATRKILSTCFRRTELSGVPEIIIVSAAGMPAVATKYKVVNILYAILKYPIPLSPKTSCNGTLQRSPNNFTVRFEAVKIKTPDSNLGLADFCFRKSGYLRLYYIYYVK